MGSSAATLRLGARTRARLNGTPRGEGVVFYGSLAMLLRMLGLCWTRICSLACRPTAYRVPLIGGSLLRWMREAMILSHAKVMMEDGGTEMGGALKRRGWMPLRTWNLVKRNMTIPCVDIILENRRGQVLLGWRLIEPYSNVWALPGGRLLKGEKLQSAASRILSEYGLSASNFHLVGVFPINFPKRSDLAICLASRRFHGEAKPDGFEFSSFQWTKRLPDRLGANYRRMIMRWRHLKRDTAAFHLAAL